MLKVVSVFFPADSSSTKNGTGPVMLDATVLCLGAGLGFLCKGKVCEKEEGQHRYNDPESFQSWFPQKVGGNDETMKKQCIRASAMRSWSFIRRICYLV